MSKATEKNFECQVIYNFLWDSRITISWPEVVLMKNDLPFWISSLEAAIPAYNSRFQPTSSAAAPVSRGAYVQDVPPVSPMGKFQIIVVLH